MRRTIFPRIFRKGREEGLCLRKREEQRVYILPPVFLEFNVRDALVGQGGREGGAEGGREDGTKAHSSTEKRNKRCTARKTKESISLDQSFYYVFLFLVHWLGGFWLRGTQSRAERGGGEVTMQNIARKHKQGTQKASRRCLSLLIIIKLVMVWFLVVRGSVCGVGKGPKGRASNA